MLFLMIITLLSFFLYFMFIQIFYLYKSTEGKSIKERIINFIAYFGNTELIKGETSVPSWEYRFIEVYNNWLDRLGSDGKVNKMREYEEKPEKPFIAYLSLCLTIGRMVLFPFRANLSWFKRDLDDR